MVVNIPMRFSKVMVKQVKNSQRAEIRKPSARLYYKNIYTSIMDFIMTVLTKSYDIVGRCFPAVLVVKYMMAFRMISAAADLTNAIIP